MRSDALPFEISGVVVSHDKNGRSIGYPTANINAPTDAPSGIFIGLVTLHGAEHPAMIFIGAPVSMGKDTRRAEAHILDFPDKDLYGENITFALLQRIRDNQKFNSLEELIAAIQNDEVITRQYFKRRLVA